jgi:MscS family membrane protein
MKDILKYKIFDNSVESYAIVFGIIVLAFLFKRFVSKKLANFVYNRITKIGSSVNKTNFINLVVQPLEVFLVLLVALGAIEKLKYPKLWKIKVYKIPLQQIFDAASVAILIISLFWLLLRFIDFVAMLLQEKANVTPDQNDDQLIVFFKDFFKVALIIICIMLILRFSFGQSIGSLLTGLSIVGAAIALALRESLENLIASFIIFFDKPFVTGNAIKVEGFTGTVERIGLRSTRVRTDQKTYISIPNKKMVDSVLDNLSMRTQRRVDIKLELSLATTSAQIQAALPAIRELLHHEVIEESNVYLSDTGQQSHVLSIEYFSNALQDGKSFIALREQINLQVIQILERLQIELAARNTDVVVHTAK